MIQYYCWKDVQISDFRDIFLQFSKYIKFPNFGLLFLTSVLLQYCTLPVSINKALIILRIW